MQSAVRPSSDYVEDYHVLQGAREERFNRAFRRALSHSGVPVECSKSEAGVGQQELNVYYSDALTMADRHAVYKSCVVPAPAPSSQPSLRAGPFLIILIFSPYFFPPDA